jgi:hypothetical protein
MILHRLSATSPSRQPKQISLDPLGHWPLCSALHAAAAAALAARGWLMLRKGLALEADPLSALPGAQGSGTLLEFGVGAQEPAAVLLFVKRAGGWGEGPKSALRAGLLRRC